MNLDFQKIFDELQPFLPASWYKVLFYAMFTEGSYSMKFFTCDEGGTFQDCFSQNEDRTTELLDAFSNIYKLIAPSRATLPDDSKWSVMTMIVDHAGTMKTEFDYEDISESTIAYARAWKEKYLHL
ncbi:MAG: antitoxin YezG family protein [Lachnospiraceae bacterium]|nr:antitoxin YezG family protein [Lachnospiraceae bacterium]